MIGIRPIFSAMKLRHRLEYAAAATMLKLCRHMPEKAVYKLFQVLGRLAYRLLHDRRKTTLRNIRIAFPEKNGEEIEHLALNAYVNVAESMALNALIMSGRVTNQKLLDAVEIQGWEHFESATHQTEQGLLIFTAHIGNWELLPQYAALRIDRNIHVIARKTTNFLIEKNIVAPLRHRFGIRVFFKENALMRMMKAIRRGEHVGILIDQKLKSTIGIPSIFFGREAPTTPTPALLHIRFGVTVLPAFMIRTGFEKYRLIIGEPIPWQDNGRDLEEQTLELTQIHQRTVEKVIREYPDQWFWMHDRWDLKGGKPCSAP